MSQTATRGTITTICRAKSTWRTPSVWWNTKTWRRSLARSLTRSLSVKWVSQSALAVNSCDLWVEWKLVAAVRQTVSPEDVHHVTTESHTVNVMMDLQSYTALRSATQCEQSYGTECTIPAQYSEFYHFLKKTSSFFVSWQFGRHRHICVFELFVTWAFEERTWRNWRNTLSL